jgi:membrane protease YdiL (CAAX protease family)
MALQNDRTAPFFLLAFAITWGLQLPGVLAQQGVLPGEPQAYVPLAVLGIFGPLIAATWLTWREAGKPALDALYAPLLRWRVHAGWYLAALVLPGALLTGLLVLLNLAGRQGQIVYFPVIGAVAFAVVGSVAEEVGWRGYALPRLQRRWGAFAAGSLIGVMWYLWHLPMFVALGVPLNLVFVMLLYFTGASLLLTWIYNGTSRSLLLVVLAHLGAHLNNSHRALPDEIVPLVVHAIVYAALGLLVMRGSLPNSRGHSKPAAAEPQPAQATCTPLVSFCKRSPQPSVRSATVRPELSFSAGDGFVGPALILGRITESS